MARAFKEYREAVKEKRENEREKERQRQAEEQARQSYIDGLKIGQRVRYSTTINLTTGKPITKTAFFAGVADFDFGRGFVWISDTKEDARKGYGATIPKTSIIF